MSSNVSGMKDHEGISKNFGPLLCQDGPVCALDHGIVYEQGNPSCLDPL